MTEIDYFKLICDLKEEFELKFGIDATHLIIGIEDFYNMEKSQNLIDRFKYIRDTVSMGVLGGYIAGLFIIKTQSIKGIKVAYIP